MIRKVYYQVHATTLVGTLIGGFYRFNLAQVVGQNNLQYIKNINLPSQAAYDYASGTLSIDPNNKPNSITYFYDIRSPSDANKTMDVEVNLEYV